MIVGRYLLQFPICFTAHTEAGWDDNSTGTGTSSPDVQWHIYLRRMKEMFAVIYLLLYLDRHVKFSLTFFCASGREVAVGGLTSVQLLQVLGGWVGGEEVLYKYFQAYSTCSENKSLIWKWVFLLHHRQVNSAEYCMFLIYFAFSTSPACSWPWSIQPFHESQTKTRPRTWVRLSHWQPRSCNHIFLNNKTRQERINVWTQFCTTYWNQTSGLWSKWLTSLLFLSHCAIYTTLYC